MGTKIPWATKVWNPFHGCTPVSAGCKFCYAKPFAKRLAAMPNGAKLGYTKKDPFAVRLMPGKLDEPYHWRKPRLVFVGSMGDMFHRSVPTSYIEQMFKVMADCQQHIFQVLTKRSARMAQIARWFWPKNVWLGTSVEDDEAQGYRMMPMRPWTFGKPGLPGEPRKIVSYEPALGHVRWGKALDDVNWLIVGCESGAKRRVFRNEWALSAIEACHNRDRRIPVFVKQIIVNGKVSKDPSEWPTALQVQEYPDAMRRVLGAGR